MKYLKELKPIDVSKYKITETGQVLKMTKDGEYMLINYFFTDENELINSANKWLEKGYLLYLYFSNATKMYECKPVDPRYYKDSKCSLEEFSKKCTGNNKLYDNVADMLTDRVELNNNLPINKEVKDFIEHLIENKKLFFESYDGTISPISYVDMDNKKIIFKE